VAGVMNLLAMVVLALVVLLEKLWSRGVGFSRAVGVLALVLAVAVIWLPALAPGLHAPAMADPMAE
jgi:predicted metal-binding membrane protein